MQLYLNCYFFLGGQINGFNYSGKCPFAYNFYKFKVICELSVIVIAQQQLFEVCHKLIYIINWLVKWMWHHHYNVWSNSDMPSTLTYLLPSPNHPTPSLDSLSIDFQDSQTTHHYQWVYDTWVVVWISWFQAYL